MRSTIDEIFGIVSQSRIGVVRHPVIWLNRVST